ncbi:type VI secretion system baseplate subunit TssG [uncultured Amphritea sp.]|uniref:type VI secretion system baseplate subunit TssG n=1 Tax=uncultured Amphritea sp. TaxID=981605 RepID=UPI00260842C9|nr:type VI secretion system baseplate subunit TssG [uncultured Amphritea sp.]
MADSERSAFLTLSNELQRTAHSFEFFKAVNLLESLHEGARVGYQGPVAKEAIRFKGHPSLAFPASDIQHAGINRQGQLELQNNFIGLYGPASPMPAHVTESIIAEQMQIENQELIEYFLTSEQQIRALRDHRLDISNMVLRAAEYKQQIRAGVLSVRSLSNDELEQLRSGESLHELLSPTEQMSFRNGQLVIQVFELPTSRQRDFLDLFNHRLTAFLYRIWHKYRPALQYQPGAGDDFSEWLFALMGAPEKASREESAINWPRLLGFSGLIAMQGNSASVLRQVVSGYFNNVPVQIIEHVERWALVPDEQKNRLGLGPSLLGEDITLGSRVKDFNSKFIVQLGPMVHSHFAHFLPSGKHYAALKEMILMLMPEQLCFDIELVLQGDQVPESRLGSEGSCYLGWSGWLGNPHSDDRNVILHGIG